MLSIRIDARGLRDLERGLGNVTLSLPGASVSAVNTVAERAKLTTIQQIPREINLSESYVAGKMTIVHATEAAPTAIVTAADQPTVLTRFSVVQMTAPASKRAKGDAAHGIPAGRKTAGVHVTVKGGNDMPYGFLVRLKAGNGWGVFTRIQGKMGKADYRHRYGPSVDQAFNVILKTLAPEVGLDLEKQALAELDAAIAKAFK